MRARGSDDGMSLIEVVVALTLTVLVMTTTAGFFIKALSASRLMQQRQSASAVAELAMERLRAKPIAVLPTVIPLGAPLTETTTGAADSTYRVSNIDYTVETTVSVCFMHSTTNVCDATGPATSPMYNMQVDVSWTPGPGTKCAGAAGLCEYSVTTLRDASLASSPVTGLKEVPQP